VTRQTADEFEPDDEDDDDVDPEAPDESDMDPDDGDAAVDDDDDDAVDTVPCTYCGHAVYEHADICPHCRNFISFPDAGPRRPLWIVVAAILALIGIGWWVVWLLVRILTRP
jgi:hypothetical protein